VHWSQLPRLHQEIKERVPKHLIIDTIPWFSSSYSRTM
jgi:hypothetical protein